MNSFENLMYLFREPEYPVIVDIEGVLVAARTGRSLRDRLARLDIVESESYFAIDATGESWTFLLSKGDGVLSPLNIEQDRTKLNLIRWFNNRKNKSAEDVEYPERSLSSKRRDRIIREIADRLIEAETRVASRPQ